MVFMLADWSKAQTSKLRVPHVHFSQEIHLEVVYFKHVTTTSKTSDSLTLHQVSSMINATPCGVVAHCECHHVNKCA